MGRLNLKKFIDYGIIGLIIFSPLPAASVYEWSVLVIQLWVLVLLGAYILMRDKPAVNPDLARTLWWPKHLFVGFFVFLGVQIIPLPVLLVKLVSPNAYSFRERFSLEIANLEFTTLSLSPFRTFQEGMEVLAYVLLGFLIVRTVTTPHQVRRIFYVLVGLGFFEAFYGLFELYRENPRVLFYEKTFNLHAVTGTFFNQNHLCGYLEMVIPLAIGLIIARIDVLSLVGKKFRDKVIHLAEKKFSVNLILLASILVMAVGIVMARSRSGAFLLLVTFLVFIQLAILYFRKDPYARLRVKRFLQVSFLLMTVFAMYVGIEATLERFEAEKIVSGQRTQYWDSTLDIAGDFPMFGTGLGTFAFVYPAYENFGIYGFLIHAHNDYLEYLSELGLIGYALLMGGIFFMFIAAFVKWTRRMNPEVKGMAMGGIVALVVIGIHSITDFNLHIPANMLLFTVILSLTLVISYHNTQRKKQ